MIVHIFPQTLKNVFTRETVILNFSQYFIVKFKVVVVLIKKRSCLLFELLSPDQILIADIFLRDDFLLKSLILILVIFLLIVLVTLTLVVSILVIDSIIEVLVVKLLILTVKFPHSRIKSNCHIFVNEHTFYLLVD